MSPNLPRIQALKLRTAFTLLIDRGEPKDTVSRNPKTVRKLSLNVLPRPRAAWPCWSSRVHSPTQTPAATPRAARCQGTGAGLDCRTGRPELQSPSRGHRARPEGSSQVELELQHRWVAVPEGSLCPHSPSQVHHCVSVPRVRGLGNPALVRVEC